jgi:hypothetical protein
MTETGGVSRSALLSLEPRTRPRGSRRLSSLDLSILSDNTSQRFNHDDHNSGIAGSFQTQMAMAMMRDNQRRGGGGIDAADRDRMGRLVLARMKTLEESFAEMIKEMRDIKDRSAPVTRRNSVEDLRGPQHRPMRRAKGNTTPKKTAAAARRPVSRRSMKESKVGLPPPPRDTKGKGKELIYSSDDEAEADESFTNRGSSL